MSIYNSVFKAPMKVISVEQQQVSIRETLQRYYANSGIDESAVLNSPLASAAQWLIYAYAGGMVIDDNFVLQEVSQEGYKIFDRMCDRDSHLFSVWDRIRTDASNFPFYLQPASSIDAQALRIFSFVEDCLEDMDLPAVLYEILRSVGLGFGVYETMYESFSYKGQKKLRIKEVEHVAEDFIRSDIKREYKFVPFGLSLTHGTSFRPKEKYITTRFRGGPYGDGLLKHCYPAYWFKRNAQLFAAQYLERWGNPALIGYHNSEEQKEEVMQMLLDIRSSTVASLPASTKDMHALEPGRQTDFMPFLNFMNDEESKVFLFGTRTMSSSGASGAYSATESHADEADDRTFDIARYVMRILNKQIIPNLVRMNFGAQEKYPFATYGSQRTDSAEDYLDKLNKTATAKVRVILSMTEYIEKTGLSRADPDIPGDELVIDGTGGGELPALNFQEGERSTPNPTFPRTSSRDSVRQLGHLTRKSNPRLNGLQRFMQKTPKSLPKS